MGFFLAILRRRLARGLLAGSPFWIAVGIAVAGRRVIHWLVGRTPEVVFTRRLAPGEGIVISHLHETHGG